MLCTSKEKMATYIGTKCGDKATQELTSKKRIVSKETMAHSNAWRIHRETTEGPKKSRGKVYSLLLGQCTQVLVDKMKQDATWTTVSELFDPILLFKLIDRFVLKQSDNQYKTAVLIAKQLSILSFRHDDQVPNATYYDWFTTRVEVACQAGVCYYTPDLLEAKCTELSYIMNPFPKLKGRVSATLSTKSTWHTSS